MVSYREFNDGCAQPYHLRLDANGGDHIFPYGSDRTEVETTKNGDAHFGQLNGPFSVILPNENGVKLWCCLRRKD